MLKIKEEDYPLIMAEINEKAIEIKNDDTIANKPKAVTQYLCEFWCRVGYDAGFEEGYKLGVNMKNI